MPSRKRAPANAEKPSGAPAPHPSDFFHNFIKELRYVFSEDSDNRCTSRRNILLALTSGNIVLTATSGIFYTGLIRIVLSRESVTIQNNYLGLLVSFEALFRIAQLGSPHIVRKFKNWRTFICFSKLIYCLIQGVAICAIPFFPMAPIFKARLIVALVSLAQLALSLSSPVVSVWHIGNVPETMRAGWFAAQSMITSICTMSASLLFSLTVDYFTSLRLELHGLIIIRLFSLLPAILELRAYSRIQLPENRSLAIPRSILNASDTFFHNPGFLVMTLICALWGLIVAIPGLFYNNYLINDLGLGYTFISVCTVLYLPFMFLMMPYWTMKVHQYGWLTTLWRVSILYLIPYALYMFVFEQTSYLYVAAVLIVHCISPANSLVFSNLPYLKLPQDQQIGCLALHNGICFLSSFLGSLIGKWFVNAADGFQILLPFGTIGAPQLLYALTIQFLIILIVIVICVDRHYRSIGDPQ